VALSLAAFAWPAAAWLIPALVAAACVLAVFEYRGLKRAFAAISVTRALPPVAGRDRPFPVRLTLTNSGGERWQGVVRDVLPAGIEPAVWSIPVMLAPGGTPCEIAREFRIPRRGLFEFGPVWVRLRGRYGLLEAQQACASPGEVKVLPEGFFASQELAKSAADEIRMLDKLLQSRQHGVGTEFESLSEYREGDDPRRIDWRTTARYGRLIMRRFQIERHRDLMILVDCGRLMGSEAGRGTKLDCAVDAALMLGRVALRGGDRCGLGIFDNQVLGYLPPVSGAQALRVLTECSYQLQSRWQESDFSAMFAALQARQAKRALIVVLSELSDAQTSLRYRASLARLTRRHVVLFAALRTPLLRRLQLAPVRSLVDGSRTAVVCRVLREREEAIHALRHAGVHVLDVEPEQLTVPLINRFIELRQGNLL
jgi:uncharacterized protein (DUF58 family)